ncbi:MAG: efflux transporter outer membrane subunit [Parachlamydiaceae bacterium]|nr:efflux transporter outer membrane subunit [Parachlamydiaceae bacterium]
MINKKFALSLLFLLTGCFRPHYEPPYVNTPVEWRLETDEASTLCNLRWWEQFQDPALNEYILIALRNNQDLKIAIYRVFEYYARLGVVKSDQYPNVTGTASYNRIKSSIAVPTGLPIGINRINNDFQAFLNLNWQLDIWGKIYSETEAANAEYLNQIEVRRGVVQTIVTSVANAYIRLRQLDSQLNVSKRTVESRIESLNLAVIRFQLGETSELEVKQAESELEVAVIAAIEFEREIPIQENLLSILMGDNPHAIARGRSIEAFQYPFNIPAGIPSDLLLRRPDIIGAEDLLIAANARITVARALFFPQFNLTGLYGSESDKLHLLLTSPAEMWRYGASAVQTIFDANRTSYLLKIAQSQTDEAVHNYKQTILNAFREVDDALISYKKNRELVLEHEKQVNVLSDYLHLAQLRYQEGEIDYLNVLDAERSLFNAQLDLVQAQSESFIAVVQLYGALGGGWIIDADDFALTGCE